MGIQIAAFPGKNIMNGKSAPIFPKTKSIA
jgi:hypothetical protein